MPSLKNDNSIITKETDKGYVVVVWDRKGYLKEAENQLNDKNVYKKLTGDVQGPLENVNNTVLNKVRDRRDIGNNTLDYFLVNNPKLGRFYLLPKMHNRLQNVPELQKLFQPPLSLTINLWRKKLNLILKTLILKAILY